MNTREQSQAYAHGAIKSLILLNGGAAVAILTQMTTLPMAMANAVFWAMIFWAVGMSAAAFGWLCGFAALRYLDNHETSLSTDDIDHSNRWMMRGMATLLVSLVLFVGGCLMFALGYHNMMAL